MKTFLTNGTLIHELKSIEINHIIEEVTANKEIISLIRNTKTQILENGTLRISKTFDGNDIINYEETEIENEIIKRQKITKKYIDPETNEIIVEETIDGKSSKQTKYKDPVIDPRGYATERAASPSDVTKTSITLTEILKKPGLLFDMFRNRNLKKRSSTPHHTSTAEGKKITDEYSPRKINRMSLNEIHDFFKSAHVGKMPNPITIPFNGRIPIDTLAFYAAQGAIMYMAAFGERAASNTPSDISPTNTMLDMVTSPIGLWSFYCFMVASGVVNYGTIKFINSGNKRFNNNMAKIRKEYTNNKKGDPSKIKNKVKKAQKRNSRLVSLVKGASMPLALSAGMLVSTIIHERHVDEDINNCNEGLNNPEERDYNFIKSCDRYYRNWTIPNKSSEYFLDALGLVAASFLSHHLVLPALTSVSKKISKFPIFNIFKKPTDKTTVNPKKESMGRITDNRKTVKNIVKNLGKIRTLPLKFLLPFLRASKNFLPFLAIHIYVVNPVILKLKKYFLAQDISDQKNKMPEYFKSVNQWGILPQEECILKEDPREITKDAIKRYERDGTTSFFDAPFRSIQKYLFDEPFLNCVGRQSRYLIDDYSNNMKEWRQLSMSDFLMSHHSWQVNTMESFSSYQWAKEVTFNLYDEFQRYQTQQSVTFVKDLPKQDQIEYFDNKYTEEDIKGIIESIETQLAIDTGEISIAAAHPLFGVGSGVKDQEKNDTDTYFQISSQNFKPYLKPEYQETNDTYTYINQAAKFIDSTITNEIEPVDISKIVSKHPDIYLNPAYQSHFDKSGQIFPTLKALFSCQNSDGEGCKKYAAAGIQLLVKTISKIELIAETNPISWKIKRLFTPLKKIRDVLVCGKDKIDNC